MSIDWSWHAQKRGLLPGKLLDAAVAKVADRLQMRIRVDLDEDFDALDASTHVLVTLEDEDGDDFDAMLLASQPCDDDEWFSLQISTAFGNTEEAWEELMSVGNALAERLGLVSGQDDDEGDTTPEPARLRCVVKLTLQANGTTRTRHATLEAEVNGAFDAPERADEELLRIEQRLAGALGGARTRVSAGDILGWVRAHDTWRLSDIEKTGAGATAFIVGTSELDADESEEVWFWVDDVLDLRVWLDGVAMSEDQAIEVSTSVLGRARLGFSGRYYVESRLRLDMLTRSILEEEVEELLDEARAVMKRHRWSRE